MFIVWLGTIIISYFLLRCCFKEMDEINKKEAPIGLLIFFMLIPLLNLSVGILLWIVFCTELTDMGKEEFIDKIFFIKNER